MVSARNFGQEEPTQDTGGQEPADRLSSELIEHGLQTQRVGRKVLVYQVTDSTNDVAWHHADERDFDGLAVFAEQQRRGRGRLGRTWSAPAASSVLCSILLQDGPVPEDQALGLLAGLSTAQAIEDSCRAPVQIRWPNDVVISGRKVAGTMIESRQQRSGRCYVIGVGINCRQRREDFPPELQAGAVSLEQATGARVDRLCLARALLRRLDHWLPTVTAGGAGQLHDEWLRRCADIGRRLEVASDGRTFIGRVIDVSVAEGLLLQLDGGLVQVFDAATTTVRR